MSKTLYFIFHGRFPSEKAAALFTAESCRAFAAHIPVVLLVPRRLGRGTDAHATYNVPRTVKVVYLPTLDLFRVPVLKHVAFILSYAVFSIVTFFYLARVVRGEDIIESNEALPLWLASFVCRTVVYEVHDFPQRFLSLYKSLFKRARLIIATNEWKKNTLIQKFHLVPEKVLMERNGVDVTAFAPRDRNVARTKLALDPHATIALYTGHLYSWKGVDTLALSAGALKNIDVYVVGGTEADIAAYSKTYGDVANLHIMGQRPHEEIPYWLSAADVLVLPNTAKEEISAHYTSPMKLFEYMASARPIVASDLPSVREVLNEENGYLAKADSPQALAHAIEEATRNISESTRRAERARTTAMAYDWAQRAERILKKIEAVTNHG